MSSRLPVRVLGLGASPRDSQIVHKKKLAQYVVSVQVVVRFNRTAFNIAIVCNRTALVERESGTETGCMNEWTNFQFQADRPAEVDKGTLL